MFKLIAVAALALVSIIPQAFAQKFPGSGPITLVVPYPPGGLSDYYARLLAPKLGEGLGATVVVDNRPGANGGIGTGAVARSKPDGHMIALVPASTVTTNQWLMKDLTYDPAKDLTPLAITLVVPNVLVLHPSVQAKSVPDLFDLIRSKPGAMNYASVGVGSSGHLQAEMMSRMANLKMVHIAFKGAGPAVQALVAGQVEMMFDNLPAVLPQIQSGQLRALAVTSAASSPTLPDLPPLGKFLNGFEATPWFGFVGPAGLPREVVQKLNEQLVRASRTPEVTKAIENRGGQIVGGTPEEMAKVMKEESEKMRDLIRSANITLQ